MVHAKRREGTRRGETWRPDPRANPCAAAFGSAARRTLSQVRRTDMMHHTDIILNNHVLLLNNHALLSHSPPFWCAGVLVKLLRHEKTGRGRQALPPSGGKTVVRASGARQECRHGQPIP